jgi:hypothetical protein
MTQFEPNPNPKAQPIGSANVLGQSDSGTGVEGISNGGPGVNGVSTSGIGVEGESTSDSGVVGRSTSGVGVHGESQQTDGMSGLSHSAQHSGVWGNNDGSGVGVSGSSTGGFGVNGVSMQNDGVHGVSNGTFSGVAGISANGTGIYGRGGKNAGQFDGNVLVNGSVTHNGNVTTNGTHTVTVDIILANADCAEEFDVAATGEIEPGMVMVLDQHGTSQPSQQAYDKKVAGVISGAGDYRPGLILDKKETSEKRVPVALVGKVYCKVDAQYASIEVGDLLTTSPTPGHAMKADNPLKAFGAVIGKALRPLDGGQGLIPILIALQ